MKPENLFWRRAFWVSSLLGLILCLPARVLADVAVTFSPPPFEVGADAIPVYPRTTENIWINVDFPVDYSQQPLNLRGEFDRPGEQFHGQETYLNVWVNGQTFGWTPGIAPGIDLGLWTFKLFVNDVEVLQRQFRTVNELTDEFPQDFELYTLLGSDYSDALIMPDYVHPEITEPPVYKTHWNDVIIVLAHYFYYNHPIKTRIDLLYKTAPESRLPPYSYPDYHAAGTSSRECDFSENLGPGTIWTSCNIGYDIKYLFSYLPGEWKAEVYVAGVDEAYPDTPQKTTHFIVEDTLSPQVSIEVPDNGGMTDDAWLSLSGTAYDEAGHYILANAGVTGDITWEAFQGSQQTGAGTAFIQRDGISQGSVPWLIGFKSQNTDNPRVKLHAGANRIIVKARDKAGNPGHGQLDIAFINSPPKLQLTGPEAVVEAFDYPLWMKATDTNRNLKQIQVRWGDGSVEYTHDVPLDNPTLQAQTEDTARHVYHRRDLSEPYSDYPITATALDEDGAASEPLSLPVRVLSLEALENDPCLVESLVNPRTVGDPIDTSNGAQILKHDLLEVKGALPLQFSLRYHSLLLGGSGGGWEDSRYHAWLETLPRGDVMVHWSDNRYNLYQKNADGSYRPTHYSCGTDTLTSQADGTFTLTRGTSLTYHFDSAGQLTALGNTKGQFLTVSHDAEGRVSQVSDPLSGAFLAYAYNADGLLINVSDNLSRQVNLAYNAEQRLTQITDAAGQTTTYTYNANGQIISGTDHDGHTRFTNTFDGEYRIATQTDGNNHTLTFSYDDSQPGLRVTTVTDSQGHAKKYTTRRDDLQLVSVQNALGHTVINIEYDAQGRRISSTDANGNVTRYTYDTDGNVHTITDPASATSTLEYDAAHNLTRAVNALGHGITLEYDANSRLIRKTNPEGHVTRYEYNTDGQLLKVTRPRGGVTQYSYSGGLLSGITKAEGQSYSLSYDAAGRLLTLTDADNNTTYLEYDGNNRVTAIVNPLGQRISLSYDSRDNILSVTDANGNVTRREYDGEGLLVRQINALNQATQYQYDSEDRLTAVTDANNHTTQLHYDAAGRLTGLTDALGNSVSLSYDAAGNLLETVDALGNTVRSLNYNARNQVTQSTDALGNSDSYQYDVLGRLSKDSDPLSNSTNYSYDKLNRLIQSIDALQGQSAQDYDEDGNRVTLTDPDGNQTWFSFDLSGRLTESRTAANSPMRYTYNARDLITQITNGRGHNHVYAYDAAGRLTGVTTPEGATAYTYDNNGNVLTVTDASGTISRQYDALNRVISYTDASGNHLGYEYDAVGNLVTLTYPDTKQVHYEYDAANRLVKVTDWGGRATAYSYDANGRLIETLRPNGTRQTRAYDAKGQLLSQTDTDAASNVIAQFGFTYDASGDISEESGIDAGITSLEGMLFLPEMTYGPGNRLATYNGETVQFDADGNMTHGPLNGAMVSFSYDSKRRLTQAGSTQYVYDAENHRIGVNGTRFVVNSQPALSQVLVKTDADGAQTFYVYGLGLIGEESAAGYKAYHFDFRGSTVALTGLDGAVSERFGYSAYGVLLSGDASLTPFLFNGMYGVMTDGNGLYHMRARFYSAEIRRFLNRDVLLGNIARGQSLNRFAFVTGKPVSFVDPFGLSELSELIRSVIDRVYNRGWDSIDNDTRRENSYDYFTRENINDQTILNHQTILNPNTPNLYIGGFEYGIDIFYRSGEYIETDMQEGGRSEITMEELPDGVTGIITIHFHPSYKSTLTDGGTGDAYQSRRRNCPSLMIDANGYIQFYSNYNNYTSDIMTVEEFLRNFDQYVRDGYIKDPKK